MSVSPTLPLFYFKCQANNDLLHCVCIPDFRDVMENLDFVIRTVSVTCHIQD